MWVSACVSLYECVSVWVCESVCKSVWVSVSSCVCKCSQLCGCVSCVCAQVQRLKPAGGWMFIVPKKRRVLCSHWSACGNRLQVKPQLWEAPFPCSHQLHKVVCGFFGRFLVTILPSGLVLPCCWAQSCFPRRHVGGRCAVPKRGSWILFQGCFFLVFAVPLILYCSKWAWASPAAFLMFLRHVFCFSN